MPPRALQRPTARRVTAALPIVAGLVVVLAVLAVVDVVVAGRAETRIAERVGEAVGVPVQAEVDGFAAGLLVLADRVPSVALTARDVPVGTTTATTVADLSVVLTDLVLDGDQLVEGTGTFVAEVTQDEVRRALPADLAPLLVLADDQIRVGLGVLSLPLDLTADGDVLLVSLPDDAAVVHAALGAGVPVPLDVPAGVLVTGAEVRGDRLVLTGSVDPVVVAGDG